MAVAGLQLSKPSPWRRIVGWVQCLPLPLIRVFLKRRVGRLVLERAGDIPLVVLPDVFNPTIFRSSLWFMDVMRQAASPVTSDSLSYNLPLPPGGGRGVGACDVAGAPSLLDIGTGSGIGAIVGARMGYRVVAVDINPTAVRCAHMNALMNDVAERVDVRHGDLFAPVAGEQFDVVLFNPPFFVGTPKNELDKAWRSRDVLVRFAEGLPTVIAPGGRAMIVFSALGDLDGLVRMLIEAGLDVAVIAERDWGNEVMVVLEAKRP